MGHILRRENIELDGHVTVASEVPTEMQDHDVVTETSQARVVEQHADHSIIEIVCSCGQVLRLRCEHSPS